MQAIVFLKRGGVLSKYRARHVIGERHNRYVRLTDDLTMLQWLPPASKGDLSSSGGGEGEEKAHSISMGDIQAVTDGAKTSIMKRMYQPKAHTVPALSTAPVHSSHCGVCSVCRTGTNGRMQAGQSSRRCSA